MLRRLIVKIALILKLTLFFFSCSLFTPSANTNNLLSPTQTDNPNQDILQHKAAAIQQQRQAKMPSNDIKINFFATHRVRKGDTLGQLARKYKVSIQQFKNINRLRRNTIYVGQNLKIPATSPTAPTHQSLPLSMFYDRDLAIELAQNSNNYGLSKNSKGHCLRGVRIVLNQSLKNNGHIEEDEVIRLGRSAGRFKNWVENNTMALCERYRLAPIQFDSKKLPIYEGLIYLYGRGKCGFSRYYGHVEIVADSKNKIVCSDHCRVLKKNTCQPGLILAPVHSCPAPGQKSLASGKPSLSTNHIDS